MRTDTMDMGTVSPTLPAPAPVGAGLHAQLAQRQRRLDEAAAQLKAELFGIDDVIDRVIASIRA